MLKVNPTKIRLEGSSFCQLRCPSCPTTTRAIHPAVGSGFLRINNFQKFIDENPQLKEIELSNYGEIFINPDLSKIVQYAHEHGVALTAENGVNLNNAKEEVLEAVVKYKFKSMTCSLDGASDENYKIYRVKGNFDNVIENIKKINFYKQKYHSEFPHLTWQFIVFGHNEHEIQAAKKMASELGMKIRFKLSWDSDFSPIKNREAVREEIGAASREEFKENHGVDYSQPICHQLWDDPQINWDGKVLGCCRNFWGDFGGNAFEDGLTNSLNNEKISDARDALLGKKDCRDDIPCATCNIYLDMKAENKWLNRGVKFYMYKALGNIYSTLALQGVRRKIKSLLSSKRES